MNNRPGRHLPPGSVSGGMQPLDQCRNLVETIDKTVGSELDQALCLEDPDFADCAENFLQKLA